MAIACDDLADACEAKLPRRGMPEAERRSHLLDVAHAVFVRDGYAASNMDDIARGAGMSKKTVYKLFASKAVLFEAVVVDRLTALHLDVDDTSLSMEEALSRRLLSTAQLLLSPAQIGLCRLVVAEGPRYPELAEAFHRAGPDRGTSSLERWIGAQAKAGRLQIEDVHHTARMLMGMTLGATHIKLLLGIEQAPTERELDASIRSAVRTFLHGAATRPASGTAPTRRTAG
jgi:AcrR family transcriptional regulator